MGSEVSDQPTRSLFDDDGGLRETPEAKPARVKKRLRDRWILLSVVGLLVAVLMAAIGLVSWYGKSVYDAVDNIDQQPNLLPTRPVEQERVPGNGMNIVLMGTDQRPTETARGRSDVLMVLHITEDKKKAYLVSLPRDYWVPIPGRQTAKINAAYSWGGSALTVETVEDLLGIKVDHVVLTSFEGFQEVINSLGGVDVINKHESSVGDLHFDAGRIRLNGEQALAFVRQRHGLPNGDFDRAERQRAVITAVVQELAGRDVLTNPAKFSDAVKTLGKQFVVDDTFTSQAIIDLGLSMRITGSGDIVSLMAPTAGFGTSVDKQSYVKVDKAKLEKLGNALQNDDMDIYVANN